MVNTEIKRGYTSLIRDIYPGETLKENCGDKNYSSVFNQLFDVIMLNAPHLERSLSAVKLYYQIEQKISSGYCLTYKDVGENIGNFQKNSGDRKGVSGARAASLVKSGLRALRHPARRKYFEPFFQRDNEAPSGAPVISNTGQDPLSEV